MLFKSPGVGLALSLVLTAPQTASAQRHEARKEHKQEKKKNSLLGMGIGLLGGAILSGGDPWATIGGAAAGGIVGNVTTKDKREERDRRDRWDSRGRRNSRDRRDRY